MPNNSGFTLIELLVAVSIVAILAAIGISVYSGAQATARDSKREIDINAIADSMELYFGHFKSNSYAGLCQTGFAADGTTPTYSCNKEWFTKGFLPKDPINLNEYVYFWCESPPCDSQNSTYTALSEDGGEPPPEQTSWFICGNLERDGIYCRENSQ